MFRYTATYPWALKQRDADGNLPLHIALKKEEPSYMVICELLRMSPETARMKDSNGDLPLFLACRRPRVSVGVLRAILQIYPESAKLKAFGNTPLHHLLHTGTASPENVKLLMSFNTNAIKTANNFGNLPLHYLCASERPHILTVRAILSEYPEGITALNHAGETPIQRALGKANDEEMRERIRILLRASTKSALNITQIELLRQLNWEARRVIILLCIELAGRNKQNNENSLLRKDTNDEYTSLMSLYHRCDGIWREIISFL